jgi:hypothetical protein
MAARSGYDTNVFINCPFDDQYESIFNAIVFAVHDCGYRARSALEVRDTGEVRIEKILRLIRESRFGIHDISRTELDAATQLPRFNMPLELGLFLGARAFGSGPQKRKVTLVLERERYSYLKYCSDINGQDPSAHRGDPRVAIELVRDWLSDHTRADMPSGSFMADRFAAFRRALPAMCRSLRKNPGRLTFGDYTRLVVGWLDENSEVSSVRAPARGGKGAANGVS